MGLPTPRDEDILAVAITSLTSRLVPASMQVGGTSSDLQRPTPDPGDPEVLRTVRLHILSAYELGLLGTK